MKVELFSSAKDELRYKIWIKAHCHCEVCHMWVTVDEMTIKEDSEGNSLCCHKICHPE